VSYDVRLATVDDTEAFVRAYFDIATQTYGSFMPPSFAAEQQALATEWIPGYRDNIERMWADLEAGREPHRRHWIARSGDEVVGIAASGPGIARWEEQIGYPDPPINFSLDKLYLRPSAQGTGLADELFELALPNGKGAYLWILAGNPRAEQFYTRRGFVADGLQSDCGPHWHYHPMFRMWRPDPA